MAQRRNSTFDAQYGTTKIERAKPHAPKIPMQGQPPVPLSLQAQVPLPNEQPQAQGQPPLHPQDEELLQMLISRFGGQHG